MDCKATRKSQAGFLLKKDLVKLAKELGISYSGKKKLQLCQDIDAKLSGPSGATRDVCVNKPILVATIDLEARKVEYGDESYYVVQPFPEEGKIDEYLKKLLPGVFYEFTILDMNRWIDGDRQKMKVYITPNAENIAENELPYDPCKTKEMIELLKDVMRDTQWPEENPFRYNWGTDYFPWGDLIYLDVILKSATPLI